MAAPSLPDVWPVSGVNDLPTWVWDLVIALDAQRDEHPTLYDADGKRLGWCPCEPLDKVPPDVLTQAQAIRAYTQAKEREAAAKSEDERLSA